MHPIIMNLLLVALGIVCLLLIGLVLIQRSKGQGTGLSFGGGAESVFGTQTGNILTRATVVLAILFLVITTAFTVLRPRGKAGTSLADQLEARDAADRGSAMPVQHDPSSQYDDVLNMEMSTSPSAPIPTHDVNEQDNVLNMEMNAPAASSEPMPEVTE